MTGKEKKDDKPRIAALVPMRHHSQRIAGKNYRKIAGVPLFHYILQSLGKCAEIDEIVVDTDSPVIIDEIKQRFKKVTVLERPQHLQADAIPMNEILMYDTSQVEADFYLQTHSTNPLLKTNTLSQAIQTFLENYPAYDSLFGVTRVKMRLWDQLGRAINHNPTVLLQTQDLPPVFAENSCIYIFTRQNLAARRNRLGERPYMFEIQTEEAWDIDEELDFSIVELLLRRAERAYAVSSK